MVLNLTERLTFDSQITSPLALTGTRSDSFFKKGVAYSFIGGGVLSIALAYGTLFNHYLHSREALKQETSVTEARYLTATFFGTCAGLVLVLTGVGSLENRKEFLNCGYKDLENAY